MSEYLTETKRLIEESEAEAAATDAELQRLYAEADAAWDEAEAKLEDLKSAVAYLFE